MKATPEWRLGDFGQQEVRRQLQAQGMFVVPAYCIEDGGAPALTSALRRHVLPDLQVFKDGRGSWVEVKTKTAAILYGKAQEHRHGVDLPHWYAYREVERETGLPGYIAILECEPKPVLLMAHLTALERWVQVVDRSIPGFPHGGAFWPRGAMAFVRVSDLQIPGGLLIEPTVLHPWSVNVKDSQQLTL